MCQFKHSIHLTDNKLLERISISKNKKIIILGNGK